MSHAVIWANARVPPEIAHMIHTHVVEQGAAIVLQRRARLMLFYHRLLSALSWSGECGNCYSCVRMKAPGCQRGYRMQHIGGTKLQILHDLVVQWHMELMKEDTYASLIY